MNQPRYHVYLTTQIISGILSFTSFVKWTRLLGSSGIAEIVVALSFCALLTDAIDFGGSSWMLREFSSEKISSLGIQKMLLHRVKFIHLVIIITAIVVFTLDIHLPLFWLYLSLPTLILINSYFQSICLARGTYKIGLIGLVAERLIWNLPYVSRGIDFSNPAKISFLIILGALAHSIVAFVTLGAVRRIRLENFKFEWKNYIKSRHLGGLSLISDLYAMDTFLISKFVGLSTSGDFSIIQKNRNVAILGFTIFSSRLRVVASKGGKRSILALLRKDYFLLLVNAIGIFVVFVFARFIISALYGTIFLRVESIMRISCVLFLVFGFTSIFTAFLVARNCDSFLFKSTLIVVPLSLVACVIGAEHRGAFGGVFGILLIQAIQLVFLFRKSSKKWKVMEVDL